MYLENFSREISKSLLRDNVEGRSITVKYKTSDFQSHTRSKTLNYYTNNFKDIYNTCREILDNEEITQGIRLIGISISSFNNELVDILLYFLNTHILKIMFFTFINPKYVMAIFTEPVRMP